MMKKSFVLGLAILLLAGLAMTACALNNQQDGVLAAYREAARATLTAYVDALNPDAYSNENWVAIKEIASTGKENIQAAANKPEINAALNAALKEIHMVDYEGRDFVLTISVEETTVKHGEDFVVDVRLKNQSGTALRMVVALNFPSPAFPYIDGWEGWRYAFPPSPVPGQWWLDIPHEEFHYATWYFGGSGNKDPMEVNQAQLLPKGTHELRFTMFTPSITQIWSNTVMLTVQ